MLQLIVITNIDLVAHKVTFNHTRAQFLLGLAQGEPIDLPLRIFVKICYEANSSPLKTFHMWLIITRLLLQRGVAPQAEE